MTGLPASPSAPSGWEKENLLRLVDPLGGSVAWVSPDYGGNTIAFARWIEGQWRHVLFIEGPDALDARPTRYGCPVLFPFPGYARNALFRWNGRERTLPVNAPDGKSHVHGFAHDRAWRVVDANDEAVTLEFATRRALTSAEREAYPFDIVVRQVVTVSDHGLVIAIEATNTGGDVAPVGLGLHPYIDPLILDTPRRELVVMLPGTLERVLTGAVPTGELLGVTSYQRSLEEDNVLICQTALDDPARASLRGRDGRAVQLDLHGGWSDIVLFAPADQPSVALEPLTCALSAASLDPASPDSLPQLAPGQRIAASVRLRLVTETV